MDLISLLKTIQKNGIRIHYDADFKGTCPIGSSKIGGQPDLPVDFEWYYFEGEAFDGTITNRPLSFLAQIDCEEASNFDKESVLPKKGMLYFFYELETMTWGLASEDKNSAKVYHYSGDKSKLKRIDFPSDLLDEYRLPEMPISFSSKIELPSFVEFSEHFEIAKDVVWDDFEEISYKLTGETDEIVELANGGVNKLVGYANIIQNDMLIEFKEDTSEWRLLFQLDSIVTKNYELLWGDSGRIYFYVNSDDLANLNFDNCWLFLQCY